MNFNFTEEQDMLRGAFREFIECEIAPHASKWDEEDCCPIELFPKMGEIGMCGIFVPEEYGGAGLGHIERVMVIEEIARYSAGLAIALFTHQLCMGALLDFGTEDQKMKYLPGLCSGELIGGLAATEPSGGSDFAGQKTTAEFKNDRWILNGRKCFITNSHTADVTVILAKTGVDDRGRGILSAFIVDKGVEGFSPGRKEHKLGLRGSTTGDLILDNVALGNECLLGDKVGVGGKAGMKEIGEIGRASMAAIGVGILRGCVEEGVKFSKERILYGKPISKLQAIQFHIAENRVDYEASRLLLYRAAWLKDQGKPCVTEYSMAKFFAVERCCAASKRTIELMGGYGIVNEYPVGRFLRDGIASISSGATNEIQKIIIASDTLRNFNA